MRSSRTPSAGTKQSAQRLGGEFYDAIVHAIDLIRANPEIGSPRSGRLAHRRFALTRFPYTIVYRVRETDVYIVAIAHTSRRPNYWKDRR